MNNYIPLTNKWRPSFFNEVIGQDNSIFILKSSIIRKKLHSSYLFQGPSGCGKTTLARIFAKYINCSESKNLNPCNLCDSCLNSDKNIDIMEIDAASHNKVNDTKNIVYSSNYTPIYSKFRVYIIDEAHMLSNSSFNYLLKTLEEPKGKVKYILITTNIKRIPETIISRCINIKFNKISIENIYNFLKKITNKEKIKYNKDTLISIAEFSDGNLRQAINILEKTISNNKIIELNSLEKILGIINEELLILIIYNIYYNNVVEILKIIDKIENKDIINIILQFQIILYKLILYKITKKNININKKYINILNKIPYKMLYIYYNIISKEKDYIKYAPNTEIAFKLIIIKITIEQNSFIYNES